MHSIFRLVAALALLLCLSSAERAFAQEGEVVEKPDTRSDLDALAVPLQQYTDPENRFSFVVPANWGRLATSTSDEVTFQGPTGDSMRISIAPMQVDRAAFEKSYVDTYMKVLGQSFEDVKYIGSRTIEINKRPAVDHVFAANYRGALVTCHQVLVFAPERVLYITFAGYGRMRETSEQLFLTSLSTFWINPALASVATTKLADPNAPSFVLAIPEGWVEDQKPDGNSYIFRPPNARATSAFISARVTKIDGSYAFKTVDDDFLAAYAKTLVASFPPETLEMRAVRRVTLGGEPAARYDYAYISNLGVRRGILVMCLRDGYIVGISCDAVEQGYPVYEGAFENLVTGFRFK